MDKYLRKLGVSWWEQELPSKEECTEALENLAKNDWKVDYIFTHTASIKMMNELGFLKESNEFSYFLDSIERNVEFKCWYFGHFHDDRKIDENHILIYDEILKLE